MLILVGVTINVALNGGLFEKAKKASYQTEASTIKEQLELAKAIKIADNGGRIPADYGITINDLDIPQDLKNKYNDKLVISADGVLYYNSAAVTDAKEQGWLEKLGIQGKRELSNFEKLKLEIEGKNVSDVFKDLENFPPEFNNSEIEFVEAGDGLIRAQYRSETYDLILGFDTNGDPSTVDKVYKIAEDDTNNLEFHIDFNNPDVEIIGLTEQGILQVEATKKVIIPTNLNDADGNMYNVTKIGEGAFCENANLETVEFEEGIDLEEIGVRALAECENLANINLPEGLETIKRSAFTSCNSLTTITIPASIINMEGDAFGSCAGLLHIYVKGLSEQPAYRDGSYSGVGWSLYWNQYTNATVHWEG